MLYPTASHLGNRGRLVDLDKTSMIECPPTRSLPKEELDGQKESDYFDEIMMYVVRKTAES